jgi:hypothetical protein
MFWLQSIIGVIYHPLAAFSAIKYDREDFKWWPAVVLLFLIFPVRVISIYITHYPVASLLPIHANIPLELFKFYVPLFYIQKVIKKRTPLLYNTVFFLSYQAKFLTV